MHVFLVTYMTPDGRAETDKVTAQSLGWDEDSEALVFADSQNEPVAGYSSVIKFCRQGYAHVHEPDT